MVTIVDVAKKAGVSPATVSNVLTGKKWVSPELTERVVKAMDDLDYTPNLIASGLRSNKTSIIGVVLPSFYHPFHTIMLKGIQDVALSTRYSICGFPSYFDQSIERKCLQQLMSVMPDGVLISSYAMMGNEDGEKCFSILQDLAESGVPIISMERNLVEVKGVHSIYANQEKGVSKLVDYLTEQGHKRIAFVGGVEGIDVSLRRKSGYLESMKKHGLEIQDDWVIDGEYTSQTGYDAMKRLLHQKNRVTAVVCGNDEIAMGAIVAAKNRNVKIPQEIAVVGFDNINLGTLINPSITTIDVPGYEIGKLAMESLVEYLSEETSKLSTIEMPTTLIKRGSTEEGVEVPWAFL